MDELDRPPRPLGWAYTTNPVACPTCGHTHDCRPTQEDQ